MKYMVMECHKGYAVLMDEASRIVHAANLRYEVGQIVESPVLLEEQNKPKISVTLQRCVAAAACVAVMAGAGLLYYRGNYTPYSTIVVCAEATMRMDISRTGKVLSVEPLNQDAAQLLSDYECSGKDQLTVTNELIDRAVESGYVQKGDTVGVYYEKDKSKDAEQFEKTVEESIAAHELQADIRPEAVLPQPQEPPAPVNPPEEKPELPAPPQPDGKVNPPEPPAPPQPGEVPAPTEPPVKPAEPEAPVKEPGEDTPPLPPEPGELPAPEDPLPPPEQPAENPPVPPLEELPVPKHEKTQNHPLPPEPVLPAPEIQE